MLTVGSLFSGIGGFELGLEWAGLGPVLWQCEIDPFCRAVLAMHWPHVRRFDDVTATRDWPRVDIICGGFPCQDVSLAGAGAGLSGERSSLWWYFARTIEAVRPRFAVVENVAGGARRWLPAVRRHLHLLGYDSTAYAISAADVGAPHIRKRIFVVAHADRDARERGRSLVADADEQPRGTGLLGARAWAQRAGRTEPRGGDLCDCGHILDEHDYGDCVECSCINGRPSLADTNGDRKLQPCGREHEERRWAGDSREALADANASGRERPGPGAYESRVRPASIGGWAPEPELCRVAHGLSGGLDGRKRRQRLRALGNAVVPQCAQVVGALIVASLTAGGTHARS